MSLSRELRHPIKVVCHRTGLTSHAIRVWERRYGLICCKRTESNRRLYSDEEIEKLRVLKCLTDRWQWSAAAQDAGAMPRLLFGGCETH
ncbi:MAG: MerR family transcriptional regulator [Verrucomicrobia bacterium]|nr:MerR family transcriptional regulator [Verrucomicrobiota bacterium]